MTEAPLAIVSGASSLVGRYLLPQLLAAGYRVLALSRNAVSPAQPGIEWLQLDIHEQAEAVPLADGAIYIHLAPIWLLPTLLVSPRCAQLQRLVAFSSTSVLSKQTSPDPAERALAQQLAAAEAALSGSGLHNWTIVRPTLIYGQNQDKNVAWIARMIKRFGFFPLIGSGAGLRQPVHAEDLARAVVQIVACPATAGKTYELSGGETLSYRAMVARIFQAQQLPERIVSIPAWLFAASLGVLRLLPRFRHLHMEMAYRMNHDLCFSHATASRDFGYVPRRFDHPLS